MVIASNRAWYHYVSQGENESEPVQWAFSDQISTGVGSVNHVRVIALNDKGWLFINGTYAGELDLSGWSQVGRVKVVGAFFADDEIAGMSTEFRDFTVRSLQILYGPQEGAIDHNPTDSKLDVYSSNAWLADTITEARFANPYATSEGSWSVGFTLRNSKSDAFHAIVITSEGNWYHYVGKGTTEPAGSVQSGFSSHISISPSGSNLLRVIALADEGWLFINGSYVEKLDLSGWTEKGSLHATGSFFKSDGIAGKSTKFDGFVIWSVGSEWEIR